MKFISLIIFIIFIILIIFSHSIILLQIIYLFIVIIGIIIIFRTRKIKEALLSTREVYMTIFIILIMFISAPILVFTNLSYDWRAVIYTIIALIAGYYLICNSLYVIYHNEGKTLDPIKIFNKNISNNSIDKSEIKIQIPNNISDNSIATTTNTITTAHAISRYSTSATTSGRNGRNQIIITSPKDMKLNEFLKKKLLYEKFFAFLVCVINKNFIKNLKLK